MSVHIYILNDFSHFKNNTKYEIVECYDNRIYFFNFLLYLLGMTTIFIVYL